MIFLRYQLICVCSFGGYHIICHFVTRNHLAPALKGVTFETRPAEKIGIVGRTGAGKSSLIVALFRLVEVYSGSITIDSADISRMSIHALR